MAKGNRGGRRTTIVIGGGARMVLGGGNRGNANQNQQNNPMPNTQNNTVNPNGITNTVMNMNPQQLLQAVQNAQATRIPSSMGLSNSEFQKFVYSLGGDGSPNLVADDVLDSNKGQDLFRIVHDANLNNVDEMVLQMMGDNNTYFSDSGGSAYGRGIYTYNDLSADISAYGTNGRQRDAVMRFKLNSNARVVDYYTIASQYYQSSLSKQFRDSESGISVYALSKGYNVIKGGGGSYYNVLSREAVDMSTTFHRVNAQDYSDARNRRADWKKMKG